MANFPIFSNLPQMCSTAMCKYSFPQKDFITYRNLNTHVSSAVNLVSGKRALSEILGKLLCLFLLLVKMAARQHVGAIVLLAVFTLEDEQIVWTDKSSDGLFD